MRSDEIPLDPERPVHGSELLTALDLTDRSRAWLLGLPEPTSSFELSDDELASDQLARLGLDRCDKNEALAARPDPIRNRALWWILRRATSALLNDLGMSVSIHGHVGWRIRFGAADGAVARYLPIWTYLAVLPHVRDYHLARGISEEVSWDSLSTPLVSVLRKHRSVTGFGGIGLFGFGTSALLAFRGTQFRLGRLEFTRGQFSLGDGPCGHVLSIHIPPIRGLTPELCESAIDSATQFFPRHFPEEPVALFSCRSWLLDPQLREYLPDTSNIIQFQRRFHVLPLTAAEPETPSDGDVAEHVFGRALNDLDAAPRETSLQRAFLDHLRAGRHWHARTGWFEPR